MKELSIEEKAKAYDEALERAKELMAKGYDVLMPELFPELKESEDECVEKIRKNIISYLNNRQITSIAESGATEKWIAWIEKQGEQKETLCDKCKEEQPSHSCQDITALGRCAVEHKQESTDKTKPKFKAGDWIVFNELTLYIKEVIQGYYRTISVGGDTLTNSYGDIDNIARLWTIQDAKPGDVLAEDPIEGYPSSFVAIYKKQNKEDFNDFDSYCFVGFYGKFYEGEDGHSTEDIHPATKVQRDLLFQKMKEAGYEWDAEKKELNKIHVIDEGKAEMDYCFTKMMNGEKVSSAWSEEDENNINSIVSRLEVDISYWESRSKTRTNEDKKLIGWLKSLRPQNRWKPSDEQLEALSAMREYCDLATSFDVYSQEVVESLYQDLKKLKE